MRGLSPATRLALGLATMTVTVLCAAQAAGILPDPRVAARQARVEYSSAVAVAATVQLSSDATQRRLRRHEEPLELASLLIAMASQNDDVRSAAIVTHEGDVLASVGEHDSLWKPIDADSIAASEGTGGHQHRLDSQVYVPIYNGHEPFGQIQLTFKPLTTPLFGFSIPPLLRTFAFIAAAGFITHLIFLRRMLRYLDPSRAVPGRVRTTLDTLAEGLVLLDRSGRVVLANASLADLLGVDAEAMKGRQISDLGWLVEGNHVAPDALPWVQAITENTAVVGTTLQLAISGDGLVAAFGEGAAAEDAPASRIISFLVNATPISSDGEDGNADRGALVSFDDITVLEEKKAQLAESLAAVRRSSDEIQRQNAELERLATHDVLTGCVNRRRLFEDLEKEFAASNRHGHPVACVLADVDHFKSVNDTHGHGVGDEVLARVGNALKETARENDLVARYGGEEFCIVMPHTSLDDAEQAAERLRQAVERLEFAKLSVTASFGVSCIGFGSDDPQELIDQADRCLYEAKRQGRNRVIRVDEIDLSAPQQAEEATTEPEASATNTRIPFHAVTALISALAYRDQRTASHCRRVADFAVATAEGLLSLSDCYILEIAALLHDLGKIGVPDHILLKTGPLTDDEWKVMKRHDRIGIEIVRASFACPPLTAVLSESRRHFRDVPDQSLAARILAVADAYDSMVSDQPYRPGCSRSDAFAELRRCADESVGQFDPEVVERLISSVRANRSGPVLNVNKESALSIGMQIEHLAAALDDQDLDRLGAMATRVQKVAKQYGVDPVAEQADVLSQAVDGSGQDLLGVLQSAGDLLSLCRSTQTTYIDTLDVDEPADVPIDEPPPLGFEEAFDLIERRPSQPR